MDSAVGDDNDDDRLRPLDGTAAAVVHAEHTGTKNEIGKSFLWRFTIAQGGGGKFLHE